MNGLQDDYQVIISAISHTLENDHEIYNERCQDSEYRGFDIVFNLLQKTYEEADSFHQHYCSFQKSDQDRKISVDISSLVTSVRLAYEDLLSVAYLFNFRLVDDDEDLHFKVLVYEYLFYCTLKFLRRFKLEDFANVSSSDMGVKIKELRRKIKRHPLRVKFPQECQDALDSILSAEFPHSKSFILLDTQKLMQRSYFNENFKRLYSLLSSFAHGGAYAVGIYGNRIYEQEGSKLIVLLYKSLLSIMSNMFVEYKLYCKVVWDDEIQLDSQFGPSKVDMPK
ncbi:MAG: hypothetical protein OXU45_04630, partial [Candidatus Melainabacteria bacterium]|nr:hypothetical protein [Candidatus Melainabacteria bacterium]